MLADITLQFLLGTSKTDITSKVKQTSLSIQKTDQFDNSLSFVCDDSISAFSGQEVIVKDGSTVIFGGIIDSPGKTLIAPGVTTTQVNAVNYRARCAQRVADGKYVNVHAGSVVMVIYSYNLIDEYEGFDQGKIDDGYYHEEYEFPIQPISQTFDDLAQASGFKWWVDDEKKLYFTREAKLTWAPNFIAESKTETAPSTGSQVRLTDLRNPSVTEDITGYINKQYALGSSPSGKYVHGDFTNTSEVSRMSSIYGGTGLYESVITNTNINTNDQAIDVAENYVQTYGYIPKNFNFTTASKGYNVNQKIWIKFPILGIDTFVLFKIKSVTITCSGIEVLYNVSCEVYTPTLEDVKQKDSWKESFKTLKTTDSNAQQEPITEATAIVFNPSSSTVLAGASIPTNVVPTPANASLKGITYTSSDVTKCTVTSEGVIVGIAAGTATITASLITTLSTLTCTLSVTVSQAGGGGSDISSGWELLTGYTLEQYTGSIVYSDKTPSEITGILQKVSEGVPIRHYSPTYDDYGIPEDPAYGYGQVLSVVQSEGSQPNTYTLTISVSGLRIPENTTYIWRGDNSKVIQVPIFVPGENFITTTDLLMEYIGIPYSLTFQRASIINILVGISKSDSSGLNPRIDFGHLLEASNQYSSAGGIAPPTTTGSLSHIAQLDYADLYDYFYFSQTTIMSTIQLRCTKPTGQTGDSKNLLIILVFVLK